MRHKIKNKMVQVLYVSGRFNNVANAYVAHIYELAQGEKGTYGFSNVMRANDVDDVIYEVTIGNVQHVAHILQQKTVTFIFWGISARLIKTFSVF